VEGSGEINIEAGSYVYLGSESDINIDLVEAGDTVRIKGAQGIFNVAVAGATNVVSGDLVLEAAEKSIGTQAKPIYTNLTDTGILTARAGTDIYIVERSGNMNVGTMFAKTGGVYLTTLSGSIVDGLDHDLKNIQAGRVVLTANGGGIGETGDYLDLDAGSSGITATASGDILIAETFGNMDVNLVSSSGGDVDLKAHMSILDLENDIAADVIGRNISLTAQVGGIGMSGNDLDIDTQGGSLTSSSNLGHTYIIEVSGDLSLYEVGTGDAYTAFILAPDRILNGRDDGGSNVSSGKTRLFAGGDIGTAAKHLKTTVGFMEGRSTMGGVWIDNLGHLTVGGLNEAQGIVAAGSVNLGASSPVTVKKSIHVTGAGENIVVTAADDDELIPGNEEKDDITVESGV
jgi:hypothetical protein